MHTVRPIYLYDVTMGLTGSDEELIFLVNKRGPTTPGKPPALVSLIVVKIFLST